MDPRRVLTFRAVARERSFSRAAAGLAITQPAVSQQVAALETELGVRLLERRPGGLALTRAGNTLLAHANAVADRLALARAQLEEIATSERRHVRVGAFPTALAALVPAAIAQVRERVPEAVVAVQEGGSDEMAAQVRAGALHLALTFQDASRPRRAHESLEREDVLREGFLVALPPGHRLAEADAVRLADLAGERWTAPSSDGLVARACRDAGFEPRIIAVMREQLAIVALVERGLAVTLVPELLARAIHGIPLRPLAGGGPRRDIYALLPSGARHPLARVVLDAVKDAASAARGG